MRTRPRAGRSPSIVAAWVPLGPLGRRASRQASSPRVCPGARRCAMAPRARCGGLERDVVVARGRARRTAGGGGREVVRVDGDVRPGAEAVAGGSAVVARAREE